MTNDILNKSIFTSRKSKTILLFCIVITLLVLAILVYYIQKNKFNIGADTLSTQTGWASEEVIDCYYIDLKLFQVDNNNLLHLFCRDNGNYELADNINLNSYTRKSSGWEANKAPFSYIIGQPIKVSADTDNLSNPNIVYQSYTTNANYDFYNQNGWQTSQIPESNSLFASDMKLDSKNNAYILFRDISSVNGKTSLKHFMNGWQNVNIPNTIPNTIDLLNIDSIDNVYLYGTENNGGALAVYSSNDNYQVKKFEFDDFIADEGFQSVPDAKYINFQNFLIDSNNKIHILARKFGRKNNDYAQDYYYLTNKNGTWKNELIIGDAIYDTDRGVSMALDESNYPHIVYTQANGLKYKYYNGSSWQTEEYSIENMTAASYLKLVIDKNNASHIIYNKNYFSNLIYHIAKQIAPYRNFSLASEMENLPTYTVNDDIDNDGITNNEDTDIDGDSVANNEDSDIDGDGIANESDDTPEGDSALLVGSSVTNMPPSSDSESSKSSIGQTTQLVSTGASLWFNILLALVLSGGLGYFLFRSDIWQKNNTQ